MKPLTLIGLTTLLTACGGGGGGDNNSPQQAQLSLAFSDAPVDAVSKVCIAVANISIHPVAGTEQSWTTASFLTSAQDDGCTRAAKPSRSTVRADRCSPTSTCCTTRVPSAARCWRARAWCPATTARCGCGCWTDGR